MKFFLIYFSLIFVILLNAEEKPSKSNLTGTWQNKQVVYIFMDDNSFILKQQGKIIRGTYTINFKVKPHQIDLFIGSKSASLVCSFKDENTIKFSHLSYNEKLKSFGAETFIFKKRKSLGM